MQRRICPVCDHVMKHAHYCSFCRQWVSNPNYINATYYLNERHPAGEANCEYHDPSFMRNSGKKASAGRTMLDRDVKTLGGMLDKKAAGQIWQSTGRQAGTAANRRVQGSRGTENRKAQQNAGFAKVIKIVMFFVSMWIVVSVLMPVLFILLY